MLIICTFKSIKIAISQPHTRGGSNRKIFHLSLNLMNVMTRFSARALIHFWYIKGGHLYGKGCLFHSFLRNSRMCETKFSCLLEKNKDWKKDLLSLDPSWLQRPTKQSSVETKTKITVFVMRVQGRLLEKWRLLVRACLLNRGACWYVCAYSIGALIGMCVLTQSGRLLVCACLLNKGAYSQKPNSRRRFLEMKRLLEGGSLTKSLRHGLS